MKGYLITAGALAGYLILTWFIGSALGLHGSDLIFMRVALWVIGILAAAVFVWFYQKERKLRAGDDSAAASPNTFGDVDALLRHIDSTLAGGHVGRGARLRSLPVFLVLGDSNATKTTTIVNSGLAPELLAGQVFSGTDVIATDPLNCWITQGVVFLEAGGRLQADPGRWAHLIKSLKSSSLRFGGRPAPRAVLLCQSVEGLFRSDATAVARSLRSQLEELSQILGNRVPTYVLFTKADYLQFFKEYVAHFADAEVDQVLGVTLPLSLSQLGGVYAQTATQWIGTELQNLLMSMADWRPALLQRQRNTESADSDAIKLGAIYEFPREFGKIQNSVVQFLVELCRPSQVRIGPFLRGFYFTGIRAVTSQKSVSDPVLNAAAPAPVNATKIFRPEQGQIISGGPAYASQPGRAAQWPFLRPIFNQILLKDQNALGTSTVQSQTSRAQQIVVISAAIVILTIALGMTVSFFKNQALIAEVSSASSSISSPTPSGPTPADLTKLNSLKDTLKNLIDYETNGIPWRFRWGLYTGGDVASHGRQIYFDRLRLLLLDPIHRTMMSNLSSLPSFPTAQDNFNAPFEALKAHLMLTSERQKADPKFLSTYLLRRWTEAHPSSSNEIRKLVGDQFEFLGDQLKVSSEGVGIQADHAAIDRAQRYLREFGGGERIYQAMLADAEKAGMPVIFNQRVPGAGDVLSDTYIVRGAFTKEGWKVMQDAMKDPARYFSSENWVLGDASTAVIDSAAAAKIHDRYVAEYISHWRQFLKSVSIENSKNLEDAVSKLDKLSAPTSPLLAVLFLVSDNTAVDSPEVKRAFQAVQYLVPPGTPDKYTGPSNQGYLSALSQLELDLEQLSKTPPGLPIDAQLNRVENSIVSAKFAVRQVVPNFNIDSEAHLEATMKTLLEQPIAIADAAVRAVPRDPIQRPN